MLADEDGYKETNTWKKRNGDWFYLDEEGEIATNQRVDDYFVSDGGHTARTNGFRLEMRSATTARDSSGRRLHWLRFWQGRHVNR
ncbi:MAG: hypothetical protein ACLR8P_16485 [Clostridium fessum]